jgi:hypothetical protein
MYGSSNLPYYEVRRLVVNFAKLPDTRAKGRRLTVKCSEISLLAARHVLTSHASPANRIRSRAGRESQPSGGREARHRPIFTGPRPDGIGVRPGPVCLLRSPEALPDIFERLYIARERIACTLALSGGSSSYLISSKCSA